MKTTLVAVVAKCSFCLKIRPLTFLIIYATCKADFFAITETWLTTDDAAVRAELCPVGYKISGRRGGGVALIYRDSLSVRRIDAGGKESFENSE